MPIERENDLHAFKSFVDEQLSGQTVPTVMKSGPAGNTRTKVTEARLLCKL